MEYPMNSYGISSGMSSGMSYGMSYGIFGPNVLVAVGSAWFPWFGVGSPLVSPFWASLGSWFPWFLVLLVLVSLVSGLGLVGWAPPLVSALPRLFGQTDTLQSWIFNLLNQLFESKIQGFP